MAQQLISTKPSTKPSFLVRIFDASKRLSRRSSAALPPSSVVAPASQPETDTDSRNLFPEGDTEEQFQERLKKAADLKESKKPPSPEHSYVPDGGDISSWQLPLKIEGQKYEHPPIVIEILQPLDKNLPSKEKDATREAGVNFQFDGHYLGPTTATTLNEAFSGRELDELRALLLKSLQRAARVDEAVAKKYSTALIAGVRGEGLLADLDAVHRMTVEYLTKAEGGLGLKVRTLSGVTDQVCNIGDLGYRPEKSQAQLTWDKTPDGEYRGRGYYTMADIIETQDGENTEYNMVSQCKVEIIFPKDSDLVKFTLQYKENIFFTPTFGLQLKKWLESRNPGQSFTAQQAIVNFLKQIIAQKEKIYAYFNVQPPRKEAKDLGTGYGMVQQKLSTPPPDTTLSSFVSSPWVPAKSASPAVASSVPSTPPISTRPTFTSSAWFPLPTSVPESPPASPADPPSVPTGAI